MSECNDDFKCRITNHTQGKGTNLFDTIYSYLKIEYLIRPTKVSETFDDFEKFAKDMVKLINWKADVLFTVKEINKIPYTAGSNNVCTAPLEDTPQKDKKFTRKANNSYPESPSSGSPVSLLI